MINSSFRGFVRVVVNGEESEIGGTRDKLYQAGNDDGMLGGLGTNTG